MLGIINRLHIGFLLSKDCSVVLDASWEQQEMNYSTLKNARQTCLIELMKYCEQLNYVVAKKLALVWDRISLINFVVLY